MTIEDEHRQWLRERYKAWPDLLDALTDTSVHDLRSLVGDDRALNFLLEVEQSDWRRWNAKRIAAEETKRRDAEILDEIRRRLEQRDKLESFVKDREISTKSRERKKPRKKEFLFYGAAWNNVHWKIDADFALHCDLPEHCAGLELAETRDEYFKRHDPWADRVA